MPHIATAGTHSCAIIAIGNFKSGKEANEAYKRDGTLPDNMGMTVSEFYTDILFPVSQPLGKSGDMPFQYLMEQINAHHRLNDKLCTATLNETQFLVDNQYWHKELKRWGFKLVRKTANSTMDGDVNYFYIRNPARVPIEKGER